MEPPAILKHKRCGLLKGWITSEFSTPPYISYNLGNCTSPAALFLSMCNQVTLLKVYHQEHELGLFNPKTTTLILIEINTEAIEIHHYFWGFSDWLHAAMFNKPVKLKNT